jgi:hypothetical protein
MTQTEQIPEFDAEEHLEAGLGKLSPEKVESLDDEVAAKKGKPEEAAFEDQDEPPLDEDEVLAEVEDEEGVA